MKQIKKLAEHNAHPTKMKDEKKINNPPKILVFIFEPV